VGLLRMWALIGYLGHMRRTTWAGGNGRNRGRRYNGAGKQGRVIDTWG